MLFLVRHDEELRLQVFAVLGPDVGEAGGRELLGVPRDDRRLRAAEGADRIRHGDLGRLVEHHEVEGHRPRRKEAGHRVRADQHARGDRPDDVAVLLDQPAHAESAACPADLALEGTDLAEECPGLEGTSFEQGCRQGRGQRRTQLVRSHDEPVDAVALSARVEGREATGVPAFGERGVSQSMGQRLGRILRGNGTREQPPARIRKRAAQRFESLTGFAPASESRGSGPVGVPTRSGHLPRAEEPPVAGEPGFVLTGRPGQREDSGEGGDGVDEGAVGGDGERRLSPAGAHHRAGQWCRELLEGATRRARQQWRWPTRARSRRRGG